VREGRTGSHPETLHDQVDPTQQTGGLAGQCAACRRRKADLELKSDIEAHGVLQNLVTAVSKPRGCFTIEPGERRRRALQALADEGKLNKSHPVSCSLSRLCSFPKRASRRNGI
jgi:hypothetical protein